MGCISDHEIMSKYLASYKAGTENTAFGRAKLANNQRQGAVLLSASHVEGELYPALSVGSLHVLPSIKDLYSVVSWFRHLHTQVEP